MYIPQIQQSPLNITQYTRQNTFLNKMPIDLLHECLLKLNMNSLLQFSLLSKQCYVQAKTSAFWAVVAKALNLSISLPTDKATCQQAYQLKIDELKKECETTIRSLQLREKLGPKIYEKINDLPIWAQTITYRKTDLIELDQFHHQQIDDKKDHFFKTVYNKDLYLIFIASNRSHSIVICFNGGFNIKGLGPTSKRLYQEHYIQGSIAWDCTEVGNLKHSNHQKAWLSIQKTLCRVFNVEFESMNPTLKSRTTEYKCYFSPRDLFI